MTQETRVSLLDQDAYRNPRHKEDADNLAAHDAANLETQDQGNEGTATEQQPVHNWEKRYKDLQSYNSRKMSELQHTIVELQKQGVPKLFVPKTPEEMEAFKAQNPDTFAVIETMAANIAQTKMSSYDEKLAEVSGDLMDTKIERASLAIVAAHPDYEAVIQSDKFHQWANTQTPEVQDWIYNNPDDPSKAIRALSLFKYESGMSQTNAQQHINPNNGNDLDVHVRNNIDPANVDRNHPAYIWKESEIARMRGGEFSKWEEVISLAQAEGRLLIGQ